MVEGKTRGYFTRREVEEGALAGRGLEIVWLKNWADAFFIHIQGSGRVRLPEGSLMRLSYSAKTGQPYTGTVNVYSAYIDPTAADISSTVPGSFMGIDTDNQRTILQT